MRLLVLRAVPAAAAVPGVFAYTNTNTAVPAARAPALLQLQGRPLRIVLYSRGREGSGLGRTMRCDCVCDACTACPVCVL